MSNVSDRAPERNPTAPAENGVLTPAPTWLARSVSMNPLVSRPSDLRAVQVKRVLDGIKDGHWADAVAQVHALYLPDNPDWSTSGTDGLEEKGPAHKRYDAAKADLPVVTFGGLFQKRRYAGNLSQSSGLVILDYDHVPDVAEVKQRASAYPSTLAAFVSPSGDGLKVLVALSERQTITNHGDAWATASALYDKQLGVVSDPSGKDIARACFVAHDPDCYIAEHVTPMDVIPGQGQASTPRAIQTEPRGDQERQIQQALEMIPPSCSREQWQRVTAALVNAELEGMTNAQALWRTWSQGSEKWDPSADERSWDSYRNQPPAGGRRIALGSLFNLAKEYGWQPAGSATNERAISRKTEQNLQSESRRNAWLLAEELGLPRHLRNDHSETDDLARLVHYGTDDLRVVDGQVIYVARSNGFWTELLRYGDGPAEGAIARLLDEARARAVDEASDLTAQIPEYADTLRDSFRDTANHRRQVIAQLRSRVVESPDIYGVATTTMVNFNRRDLHPVMPLADGGAVDLSADRVLSAAQIKPLLLLDHGWHIRYRPELLEPGRCPDGEAGIAHYAQVDQNGATDWDGHVLRRMALHLLAGGAGLEAKVIDAIKVPAADAGKTALADWMAAAMPGTVAKLEAKHALSEAGARFTQVGRQLAERVWVFLDECDKVTDTVSESTLNVLTNTTVRVEQKGRDAHEQQRLGVVITLGADWLPFDADAQGARARWKWAMDANLTYMPSAFRSRLLSGDAPDYLAAWLIRAARDIYQRRDDATSPASRRAVASMLRDNADPVTQTLREILEGTNDSGDRIAVEAIKEQMKKAGLKNVKAIHSSKLDRAIKRVSIKSTSVKGTGGIRMRTHLRFFDSAGNSPKVGSDAPLAPLSHDPEGNSGASGASNSLYGEFPTYPDDGDIEYSICPQCAEPVDTKIAELNNCWCSTCVINDNREPVLPGPKENLI